MSSAIWLTDELSSEIKQNDNFHTNSENVVKDIISGKLDITALVERLSSVLTDINPEFRARGMIFFSNVLSLLPNDFLTEVQLKFISTFYVDRLKDNHRVIPPVLEGVIALSKMKNLPNIAPSQILMSIYNNVPCQQQVRSDRYSIYSIINKFLQSHTEELKSMGPDLVYGVISAMDGERDPRNLVFLFSFLPKFLKTIPLGHLSEEMFEVIACYYPIDFNSSADDPNAISRNDLANKLCICLCATPVFSEFCMSLLLEKLDSKLRLAKLDSLKLLKQSCSIFPSECYDLHLQNIWSMLQLELANSSDTELTRAAHDALQALVSKLCSDSSNNNSGNVFLDKIITTSKLLLADAKTKSTIELPLRVLLTTANASEKSCIFVIEKFVPLLIIHYHLNPDESLQLSSLTWFALLFDSCKSWNLLLQMSSHFNQISTMCINAINSDKNDLKISSLSTISTIAEIIQSEDAKVICQILDQNIHHHISQPLKDSSKKCLLSLVKIDPILYSDYITEKLNIESIIEDNDLLEKRLDMLCSLYTVPTYSESIIEKLLLIFYENKPQARILIDVFLKNFETGNLYDNNKICQMQKEYNLIKYILQWSDQNMFQNDFEILDSVSKLLIRIMKTLKSEVQSDILEIYMGNYIYQLSGDSTKIILLEALLNSCQQDVEIIHIDRIVSYSMNLALNDEKNVIQKKSCFLVANILNKYGKRKFFSNKYQKVKNNISKIMDCETNNPITPRVFTLYSWITKSLLQNGHPDSPHWLGKLAEIIMDDKKQCFDAAKSFKLIMSESTEALNTECFCTVGVLYKQKVFHLFLRFTSDIKCTNREPYLLAWAYIIQSVPKTVLQMESSKISSILIESLDFTEQELLLTTLDTLAFLIQMKNSDISGSLQSLIPRCIKHTTYKSSMKVRMGSLQCLYNIANFYSTFILLPYKDDVIMQLSVSLDDPKRLVRCFAVKARTRWFLVGSPGEEKIKS